MNVRVMCGFGFFFFFDLFIDMCFRMNDAMLYVRCMLECAWVRIRVLNCF